jgi:hypothetical protein
MTPKRPRDHRALPPDDFRAERTYLADHVFASVGGGGEPASDVVDQDAWESMFDLPTDVLLRTTDHLGAMVDDMHDQWSAWIFAVPTEPESCPFMFEPALDTSDEFSASPFMAAHGWYRQATFGLRNALEGMACGAALAVRNDDASFKAWRAGTRDANFGNAVDLLGQDKTLAAIDQRLGAPGLFGHKPDGVMRETYAKLSRYAHSQAGHTNGDIWQSNGPVFIPRAFTQL